MKEKRRFSVWALVVTGVSVLIATLLLVFGLLWVVLGPTGLGVAEAMAVINLAFVGEHDMVKATDAAMDALITGLGDRWSYYMDSEGYTQQKSNKSNSYVGIGASVQYPEGEDGFVILRVAEGGPAEQAGLQAGDRVLTVDGVRLTGEDRYTGSERIKGEAGGVVTMEVQAPDGGLRTVEVTRARVEEHPVSYVLLEGNTGLITIKNFNARCALEAEAAVEDLKAQGAERLVFDVRNNGGGFLDELTDLLDYLLPEGVIFRSETRYGAKSEVRSDSACVELPMAVLVNENTYSAAELFAAELREMNWGIVVGTPTTGKGFSQQTFPLLYGGAMNLSTAKYFTGGGVSLIGTGLMPEPRVDLSEEEAAELRAGVLLPGDDRQLQEAIKVIS